MQNNITTNPGIYIHIPFCERKCIYCDFYSVSDRSLQKIFVQSLLIELQRQSAVSKNEIFDTIYFGGGTPSLLSVNEIELIIDRIKTLYNISAEAEITIEVNPGTVDRSKLNEYKKTGINRLSIGIQSFNDDELRFLGRIHNARQARETIAESRSAGFKNISLDFISSLPQQTLTDWRNTLKEAAEYQPEHISVYTLIIEDGTPLHEKVLKKIVKPKRNDEEAAFFETTMNMLEQNGYLRYEISSFSKTPVYISRHNFKYWNHSAYLGFGPSAHSFWNKRRFKNVVSLTTYAKKINAGESAEIFSEIIDDKTLEFEYIFLGLRTFLGINLKDFNNRFKANFKERYGAIVKALTDEGFARLSESDFKLTSKGLMLSDEILPDFAP